MFVSVAVLPNLAVLGNPHIVFGGISSGFCLVALFSSGSTYLMFELPVSHGPWEAYQFSNGRTGT